GHFPADYQLDARAGAGKLRHTRDRAVLAITVLHLPGRPGRARRCRIPPAVPETFVATVSARRHGPARSLREPAVFPLWRRAKNGAERRHRRLPAVRPVEN